jgi:hypothetical protein
MGISSILERTATFGNFKWGIVLNDFGHSPLFTSDFPAAIEKTDDARILKRFVPLAPNLALRIRPDLSLDRGQADFSFRNFGFRTPRVSRQEVMNLICLIVRLRRGHGLLSRRPFMDSALHCQESALPH